MGVTLRRHDFRICHASIQATHLHLIVEADDRMALARGMQGFEIACARRFNASIRRRGKLFWDRYHPVALRTPQQVRNAVSYCLNNWRRHREDRHAPAHVRLDPYSSAPQFSDWTPPPTRRGRRGAGQTTDRRARRGCCRSAGVGAVPSRRSSAPV
jgi:hypothetical protein